MFPSRRQWALGELLSLKNPESFRNPPFPVPNTVANSLHYVLILPSGGAAEVQGSEETGFR